MRLRLIIIGVLALAATACGPPPPPVLVESSQVETLVYWSSDLNGRQVSMDGYIGFDNGPNGEAIALGQVLTTQPSGQGEELIRIDLERGDGPNQLQLPVLDRQAIPGMPGAPEILTVDTAKATFQDQAGQAHPLGDKVRITGRLTYVRAGNAGLVSDEDSRSPTGRRFKPRLTNVVLEAAPGG